MGTPRRRVHANRRLGAAVYPATAGLFPATIPLDFWLRGDDPGANFGVGGLSSLPNRGAVAPLQFNQASVPVPTTTRGTSARRAPLHTGIAAFNGDTLTAERFSIPTGACELWIAVWIDSLVPTSQRLIGNRAATAGQKGFYVRLQSTGRLVGRPPLEPFRPWALSARRF